MPLWSSLLLAIALSIDSLGVGIAYGLRGIRVTPAALAVLGLCSAGLMSLSMALGTVVSPYIHPSAGAGLGGIILLAIGFWQLTQGWRHHLSHHQVSTPDRPLLHVRVPVLGVAVQVLRDPLSADSNASGTIEGKEAFLLGAALGLDAFGAGFGAAMAGFPFWIVPTAAAATVALVFAGARGANRGAGSWLGRRGFALPSLLLIGLGLWKLFSG